MDEATLILLIILVTFVLVSALGYVLNRSATD
jgi:hypothetical protein